MELQTETMPEPIKHGDYFLYRGCCIRKDPEGDMWYIDAREYPYIYGTVQRAMVDIDIDANCLKREIKNIEEEGWRGTW